MKKLPKDHQWYGKEIIIKPLKDLGLDQWVINALDRANIRFVYELLNLTEVQITNIQDISRKRLKCIKTALHNHYIPLDARMGVQLPRADVPPRDLREFFGIRQENEYILKIALPERIVDEIGEERVIEAIKGTCQKAFELAVRDTEHKLGYQGLNSELAGIDRYLSFPMGTLRNVHVAVAFPECFDRAGLTEEFVEGTVGALGGIALYTSLEPIIDGLIENPRP